MNDSRLTEATGRASVHLLNRLEVNTGRAVAFASKLDGGLIGSVDIAEHGACALGHGIGRVGWSVEETRAGRFGNAQVGERPLGSKLDGGGKGSQFSGEDSGVV